MDEKNVHDGHGSRICADGLRSGGKCAHHHAPEAKEIAEEAYIYGYSLITSGDHPRQS